MSALLPHILAKSKPEGNPETLVQHTDYLIRVWLVLRKRYEFLLEVDEDFWFDSFIAVLFHDFGKLSQNFQETLRKALKKKSVHPGLEHLRHEFLSGMLLAYHSTYETRVRQDLTPNQEQVFAVLTHHKNFTPGLFDTDTFKKWALREQDFTDFINYAQVRIRQYFPARIAYLDEIGVAWQMLSEFKDNLEYPYDDKNTLVKASALTVRDKPKTGNEARKKYLLHKALLVISDWTASGHRELEEPLQYAEEEVRVQVAKRAGFRFEAFRDFQLEAGRTEGNVLAIAPTGSGKTEASLLWAANREHPFYRIIYLLPTRVTANSLFMRMNGYFGKDSTNEEYTAVVHSSAKMLRQELDENYDDFSYYRESTFFKSISVATVDQLLTQGFNVSRWELKTFHLFRARVIVDEVHAYAPYTLGLLVATIKYLRQNFQTQFFIMTATMPTQLREILAEALDNEVSVIKDQELLEARRNIYRVEDKTVDELFSEIKGKLKEEKKVLLVVNTVNEAIRLYDAFSEYDCYCYHSRFIVKHRSEKEQEIEKFEKTKTGQGFLLVATQVVEVSLDIDYDCLYTENAPIDAIVQRAGRVNRKRDKKGTEVVVFKHLPITEIIYDAPEILQNTFNFLQEAASKTPKLSENDLLELVDKVYASWKIKEHPSYLDGLTRHEKIIREHCAYIRDFDIGEEDHDKVLTREGLDTVTIIPMCFKEELLKVKPKDKIKFGVTIRRKLYQTIKAKLKAGDFCKDKDDFEYLEVPYDDDKGLYYTYEQAQKIALDQLTANL